MDLVLIRYQEGAAISLSGNEVKNDPPSALRKERMMAPPKGLLKNSTRPPPGIPRRMRPHRLG
jgi:hypothetical protein